MPSHLQNFTFIALGFITVGSAFLVVSLRNLIHAALMLGVSFVGVAGLYLLLNAEFIAAAQVLVYVGAITVLILFAIMLTQGLSGGRFLGPVHYQPMIGGTVAALMFFMLGSFLWRYTWPGPYSNGPLPVPHTTAILGVQLLTNYIIPFEVSSVLLLVALVAAIILARDEETASVEPHLNLIYDDTDSLHATIPANGSRNLPEDRP
jgi:NADH:ubiquinone oxidoreductase subunit 6 (subunit J)